MTTLESAKSIKKKNKGKGDVGDCLTKVWYQLYFGN